MTGNTQAGSLLTPIGGTGLPSFPTDSIGVDLFLHGLKVVHRRSALAAFPAETFHVYVKIPAIYGTGKVPVVVARIGALLLLREVQMKQPFSQDEQAAMDLLVQAHAAFCKLESQHPNEAKEWAQGIHACQNVLGWRVLRRDYPDQFPTIRKPA